ncbi:uncharacterized protein LOC120850862 [Ixodes scapularis]|uniref:uncharacterized protein LOC120850862 n=1 Tax=Ixodes scapularis TaxID=6945 RepID=UPI001A9E3A19|nr:uncharacterized protein LOC120850862 [Ixodes scapularis]
MKDLLQPYKLGEDIGLFLVNFERTCEKVQFLRETWPHKLVTLLPCEAADVIARLTREDADNYDQVKAALLKKYRLSTEAFRQRFRQASRKPSQSWPEFAYNLKADLIEWLKSAGAHGDHDKVVECVATEQFFRKLPDAVMFWVQDRLSEPNLMKAAELAKEHAMRRGLQGDSSCKAQRDKEGKKAFWSKKNEVGKPFPRRFASEGSFQKPKETEVEAANRKVGYQPKPNSEGSKVFKKRRPSICFNCKEPGYFAASCTKKVAFHYVCDSEDNERLLEPYTRQMLVNGKECRVLRDSTATMDVVHPIRTCDQRSTLETALGFDRW